jgi:hypothetical protein
VGRQVYTEVISGVRTNGTRRTPDSKPPNFLPVFANGGAGIVPVISPGRMTKMDDEIAVVRRHTIAETDFANGLPVSNGSSLTLGKKNKS